MSKTDIEVIAPFIKVGTAGQWINVHDIKFFSLESGFAMIYCRDAGAYLNSIYSIECEPDDWKTALKKALGIEGPK